MSFLRHAKIYRSDSEAGERNRVRPSDRRCDESSTGDSLAGCSPAEPASASPVADSLTQVPTAVNCFSANGKVSLIFVSQHKGAVQFIIIANVIAML